MSRQGLFLPTDPMAMSETFADDGRLRDIILVKYTGGQQSQLRMATSVIPRRELQMMCAHLVWGKGQEEIARQNTVTQGDVSYRIKRARERMALWHKIDSILKESELREILYHEFSLGMVEIAVVLGIYRTTSQSVCAKALRLTQGNVRHTFVRVKELVASKNTVEAKRVTEVLTILSNNYNRLRALDHQSRWAKKFK